jgi:hypothetical protein
MHKKKTFIDSPEWTAIVNNIKGIMTSDSSLSTLMDFERVLDEADIYAYKNWGLGELADGPVIKKYDVRCTFMWPYKLMPDPRGAKRLLPLGCKVFFKETEIESPIKIDSPSDFKPGTHYPKIIKRKVWLISIVIPKQLMSDIRQGSVEIAEQTIDLEDLDRAYEEDYDTEGLRDDNETGEEGSDSQPPGPEIGLAGGPEPTPAGI